MIPSCPHCGRPATHELQSAMSGEWEPVCAEYVHECEANYQDVYHHEMERFNGAYGLPSAPVSRLLDISPLIESLTAEVNALKAVRTAAAEHVESLLEVCDTYRDMMARWDLEAVAKAKIFLDSLGLGEEPKAHDNDTSRETQPQGTHPGHGH